MPVAREKVAQRRRTASTSSDCGQLPSQLASPKSRFLVGEFDQNDVNADPLGHHHHHHVQVAAEPAQQCCSPKCTVLSELDPQSPEPDSVKMICSNEKCPYSCFMHAVCYTSFEEQMLSCLRGMSRARSWSEKQRKQNLWTKKGYDLIHKMCTCRCNKGALRRDLNFTMPEYAAMDKGKRKRKKSASGEKMAMPIRATNGAQRARSRTSGRNNSDSISSENGGTAPAYMQPFAHRADYSVFEKLLPRHLVNSYHIKMEDDGYGAGDDTRSFVLSSLAFHRTSFISCVLCSTKLTVYDQFPLVDGTFYLSPLRPNDSALEVEGKGDDPVYLSAICLKCLVGKNRVTCRLCSSVWNGNHHQIGTMYTYDLFASFPCCTGSVECNQCQKQLLDPSKITLSFSQLSLQAQCSHCGANDYHFIKPVTRFQIGGTSTSSSSSGFSAK